MSIKAGDRVIIKDGGKAEFQFGRERRRSSNADEMEAAKELLVNLVMTDGDLGITLALPFARKGSGIVSRDQVVRLFAGGFREGQQVVSNFFSLRGVVVDQDPNETQSGVNPRGENVPVKVEAIYRSDLGFGVGQVVFMDPGYLKAGTEVNLAAALPRHTIDIDPKLARNAAKQAVSLAQASLVQDEVKQDPPQRYEDVTRRVNWTNLQVGDIVTAEHKSSPVRRGGPSTEVTNSRTSEVVRDKVYGHKYWCELELSSTQRYDPYTITKVLRPAKPRTLAERRRPISLRVMRVVPEDGVWPRSTRTAFFDGVVEFADDYYWALVIGGQHDGKKIRLKAGRDLVSYKPIAGDYEQAPYQNLQNLTHDPA